MLGQSKGWQQNLLYFLEILYNVWVDTFFSLVIVQVCRAWLWLKMFTFRNKISIWDPEKIDQKIAMHGKITASAQKWPACSSFASVEPFCVKVVKCKLHASICIRSRQIGALGMQFKWMQKGNNGHWIWAGGGIKMAFANGSIARLPVRYILSRTGGVF